MRNNIFFKIIASELVALNCLYGEEITLSSAVNVLTASSEVRNFGNTIAIKVIFLSKCSKFNLDFKTAEKSREKVFCF